MFYKHHSFTTDRGNYQLRTREEIDKQNQNRITGYIIEKSFQYGPWEYCTTVGDDVVQGEYEHIEQKIREQDRVSHS